MKKKILAVVMVLGSLGAFAQSNMEVRGASNLEGGVNYVGVRRNAELVTTSGALALNLGLEAGMLLGKANLGPSAGVRVFPSGPISLNASVQRNILLGETSSDIGGDVRINNSGTRLGIGKISNERGSTTYVGVRVPTGSRRQ